MAVDNLLVLSGSVTDTPVSRTTPAGIPIMRFYLDHQSEQLEAGHERTVQCRMRVVVVGKSLNRQMASLREGDRIKIRGFLSKGGYRSADTRIELHALDIKSD
ncbi:MAG: primosomal replication protein N [Gammaproteobacteria bacterium]